MSAQVPGSLLSRIPTSFRYIIFGIQTNIAPIIICTHRISLFVSSSCSYSPQEDVPPSSIPFNLIFLSSSFNFLHLFVCQLNTWCIELNTHFFLWANLTLTPTSITEAKTLFGYWNLKFDLCNSFYTLLIFSQFTKELWPDIFINVLIWQ